MSLRELYSWQWAVRQAFGFLGCWQVMGLALYSYGVILARQCAPSRVAEKLSLVGKADTVQRRLERFLHNPRIDWQSCCQAWAKWVLSHYTGERIILLVDETKLAEHLSVMVVGLAYRQCCIPLAFWCYWPSAWPMKQVDLIGTLLSWVAPSIPSGVIPLVQADRGIGTSPDLLRRMEQMGWYFEVRVQKNTRLRREAQPDCPLAAFVSQAGQTWRGSGKVFKKAGWLEGRVLVLWGSAYAECWCIVTNCPWVTGWEYAVRYWQEAGFRDLKSDGWQWHVSRIWTPAHANRLLLVLALAYAWVLTLGTLVCSDADLAQRVTKGRHPTYSLFRLGLRLWEQFNGQVSGLLPRLTHDYLCFLPLFPDYLESVGE
jgi:hypothetical protein